VHEEFLRFVQTVGGNDHIPQLAVEFNGLQFKLLIGNVLIMNRSFIFLDISGPVRRDFINIGFQHIQQLNIFYHNPFSSLASFTGKGACYFLSFPFFINA